MIKKSKTYAKNKLGKSPRGVVNAIVDDTVRFSKSFIKSSKDVVDIQEYNLPSVNSIPIHLTIFFHRIPKKRKPGIHGSQLGNNISIRIYFDPNIADMSIDEWEEFAYNLRFVLYHELGHVKREPQIGGKRISTKPPKAKRRYPRMPLELDANISAIVDIMHDLFEDYGSGKYPIKFNTHLFFSIMQNFPMFQKAYSTPKWRKIIIKRLLREGIEIK